ncbi:MAG: FtsW/RodA/SpoVE family cell cycle protein [Simkaniaceae bacterium]|nr:FtsW/RodA/SpoVE family cell cycle protein [Simkaniaceae bacterium]
MMMILRRIDLRTLPILLGLMAISLIVISSMTAGEGALITREVISQFQFFCLGLIVYFIAASVDYRKIRDYTWVLYGITLLLLLGLFLTPTINGCHRWYRLPLLPFAIQPSEIAKLVVVIALAKLIDERAPLWLMVGVVFIPFALIYKQPDLGSALILFPMTLAMFYFGKVSRRVVKIMGFSALTALMLVVMIFLGIIDHEKIRPYVKGVLKEYQYERLNPNTYHQTAAQIAIALGGISGSGYHKSEYSSHRWLPYAHTDSVFPAYVEEFGLLGAYLLIGLYFGLIYCSFQVVAVAKDPYGRALAAGLSVYLAVHVIINMGMMCGLLPITGVPLLLVTSGGSSVLSSMAGLGALQSIYTRRFMF